MDFTARKRIAHLTLHSAPSREDRTTGSMYVAVDRLMAGRPSGVARTPNSSLQPTSVLLAARRRPSVIDRPRCWSAARLSCGSQLRRPARIEAVGARGAAPSCHALSRRRVAQLADAVKLACTQLKRARTTSSYAGATPDPRTRATGYPVLPSCQDGEMLVERRAPLPGRDGEMKAPAIN